MSSMNQPESVGTAAATPVSPMFGARIDGIDLARLAEHPDHEQIAWLRRLLENRLLLRFSGQRLTQKQLTKFVAYFGALAALRNEGSTHQVEEGIKLITNERDPSGKAMGDPPPYELGWHTDGSYTPRPTSYTALYCVTAPTLNPPKTYWIDMDSAFAALPASRQRELAAMKMLHYHPKKPTMYAGSEAPTVGNCRAIEHPLVRRVPETGRATLFMPTIPDCPILADGERWSQKRSAELVAELYAAGVTHGQPWETILQADDLVFWDNRAMAHCRDNVGADVERVLWHAAIEGEVPAAWPAPSDQRQPEPA